MVLVYLWPAAEIPDEDGVLIPYVGHVAFKTDEYYVSFWPRQKKTLYSVNGVPAGVVIHYDLDYKQEGDRHATMYDISHYASNASVNQQLENFFRYNNIDPADLTIEKAEEIVEDCVDAALKSLSITKYSFKPDLISDSSNADWYNQPQSCISFCFNILQMASTTPIVIVDKDAPHKNSNLCEFLQRFD